MSYVLPLLFVIATIVTMVVLMRRRVMKERFTVWWAVLSVGVVIFVAFPPLLPFVAEHLGFQTPSNFVFFIASLMLLLMSVQFSVEISQLEEKTRTLAEQLAILRAQTEQRSEVTTVALTPETAELIDVMDEGSGDE
ncbi:MAG TPA: DUF2304 domain-containing protein [Propionibacteriaceae bacterium]|nr:DUF2304 domain-containing protein [Propionibacteriaceae bacterium]